MMSTPQVVPYSDFSLGRATAQDPAQDYRHWIYLGIDHSAGKLKANPVRPRYENVGMQSRPNSGVEIRGGFDIGDDGARLFGFKIVHRGWPTEVLTWDTPNPRGVISRDDAQNTMDDDDSASIKFSVGRTTERQWARDLAWNLQSSDRLNLGIRVLESALDLPRGVMYWIAAGLFLPVRDLSVIKKQAWLRDFDPSQHLLPIPNDNAWRGWLLMSARDKDPEDYLYDLTLSIRDTALESCVAGEAYCQSFYDGYIAEMREALIPGQGGLRKVTDSLRMVCQELELPTPEDLARQVAIAQAQAAASQVVGQQSIGGEMRLPSQLMQVVELILAREAAQGAPKQVAIDPDNFPQYEVWLAEKKKAKAGVEPAEPADSPTTFSDFSASSSGAVPESVVKTPAADEPATLTDEAGAGPQSRTLREKAKDEAPFAAKPPKPPKPPRNSQ